MRTSVKLLSANEAACALSPRFALVKWSFLNFSLPDFLWYLISLSKVRIPWATVGLRVGFSHGFMVRQLWGSGYRGATEWAPAVCHMGLQPLAGPGDAGRWSTRVFPCLSHEGEGGRKMLRAPEGWEEGEHMTQKAGEWSRWEEAPPVTDLEDNGSLTALNHLRAVPAVEPHVQSDKMQPLRHWHFLVTAFLKKNKTGDINSNKYRKNYCFNIINIKKIYAIFFHTLFFFFFGIDLKAWVFW